MTSNVGAGRLKQTSLGFRPGNSEKDYEDMKDTILGELKYTSVLNSSTASMKL